MAFHRFRDNRANPDGAIRPRKSSRPTFRITWISASLGQVDHMRDLALVYPTCHRVLHKHRPIITPADLRAKRLA